MAIVLAAVPIRLASTMSHMLGKVSPVTDIVYCTVLIYLSLFSVQCVVH